MPEVTEITTIRTPAGTLTVLVDESGHIILRPKR
jgi:hypothetical protein